MGARLAKLTAIALLLVLTSCAGEQSEQEQYVEECISLLTYLALIYRTGADADEAEMQRMETSVQALIPRTRNLNTAIEAHSEPFEPIFAPELVASINRYLRSQPSGGDVERRLYQPVERDAYRLKHNCMNLRAHPYGS